MLRGSPERLAGPVAHSDGPAAAPGGPHPHPHPVARAPARSGGLRAHTA
ncbi:MAG: hypothetical protein LBE67_07785 [Kocuria palustris]|nr:hypothetical protein [Kocuria palustris]